MTFRFSKNERGYSDLAFRFMRKVVIPYQDIYCAPRMINRENMPITGPCFIYANHANNFDPFLINHEMTHEPTAGVMTRYQFYKFFPRMFMDSIGVVPTNKYVPDPGIIRKVMKMIDQQRMIVIFPEGGRRWDGQPKPLIESTLKLFWRMRIPVHPVQIQGAYLHWPRWADYSRRSSIELHWQNPLHPKDFSDYSNFADTCRKLLDFDEYNPPPSALPIKAQKPASGINRLLYRCPYSGVSGSVFTPDGENIYSRTSGKIAFTMDKDSRLIDRTGKRHSLIDFYHHIRKMPIVRDSQSIVIRKIPCKVYRHNDRNLLTRLGNGYIELMTKLVVLWHGSDRINFPLEELRYNSIEKNDKLLLTTKEVSYMVDLGEESALKWQHYIRRLQNGESTVTSL